MSEDLLRRTKKFALAIIQLSCSLRQGQEGWVLGKQVLRSGTSIGANYREAQRSRTRSEFVSKIQICQQELEETAYWIELIHEARVGPQEKCAPLLKETAELKAIFSSIAINTSKGR